MALGASFTPDSAKVLGVKNYLRRTKSTAELQQLADDTFFNASEEVTITSTSSDGASAMGQISFPKWLLLGVIEELLLELGVFPGTTRQLATRPDFSRTWTTT
jgi:hypothetical protein